MTEETITIQSNDLTLHILKDRQTVSSLSPNESIFDFVPDDCFTKRNTENYYHLGDVTLRVRKNENEWENFSSASKPQAAIMLDCSDGYLTDLTPTFNKECPLIIHRKWSSKNGRLTLKFELHNRSSISLEVGSFGVAMVFNNVFTGRNLVETHEKCSFTDPYIGGDAGYLQVTRLNGQGPVLIVYPNDGTTFEAYRMLRDDPTQRGVTFEGFYEWMVHSKAYASNEWKKQKPWNEGTSVVIESGQSISFGFIFVLSPEIREIENTLINCGQPVAISLPGYVLPLDQSAQLLLKHTYAVESILIEPKDAIDISKSSVSTKNGWQVYSLKGNTIGRSSIVIYYKDGKRQAVQYNVIPPEQIQVRKLAEFHQNKQWFSDRKDPFKRTFAYLGYDREADRLIIQDRYVFNAGLSDENGAGPNLLMAMKNCLMPDKYQIEQLELYIDNVLWGNLQNRENYGVHASLFYYDSEMFPGYYDATIDWNHPFVWNKKRAGTTWRAYNYPHQAAIYWCLYRISRNYTELVKAHPWNWYLKQAYRTGLALKDLCGDDTNKLNLGYETYFLSQYGLMDGTIFLEILADLRREGWDEEANEFENYMKERAERWNSTSYPFGSEMPWDSTGQEEVYMWCKHFRYSEKSLETLNAILAYMPLIPNWAYNGAARRYFDSFVYGKIPVIFRETCHYGASLNAIPVLDAYRDKPEDLHLLRAGYAGNISVLNNINEQGHGSMLFTPDSEYMDFEPYSGDYGSAFFGYAYDAGAYVYYHPEFGWQGFSCNIYLTGAILTIEPKDAFRKRIFIAPIGLWLTLDTGVFIKVEFNVNTEEVKVTLSAGQEIIRNVLLRIKTREQNQSGSVMYFPEGNSSIVRGAYEIPINIQSETSVLLRKSYSEQITG